MTDYKVLVDEARRWVASPNNQHGHGLTTEMADAVEALVTERAARRRETSRQTEALAESRARYADMEARVVELEAVIQKTAEHYRTVPTVDEFLPWARKGHGILSAAPSVVLADHDREVAARALEAVADDWANMSWLDSLASVLRQKAAQHRVADQNGEHA